MKRTASTIERIFVEFHIGGRFVMCRHIPNLFNMEQEFIMTAACVRPRAWIPWCIGVANKIEIVENILNV